jgi:biopolymer transport protein ExbB/TolQ
MIELPRSATTVLVILAVIFSFGSAARMVMDWRRETRDTRMWESLMRQQREALDRITVALDALETNTRQVTSTTTRVENTAKQLEEATKTVEQVLKEASPGGRDPDRH